MNVEIELKRIQSTRKKWKFSKIIEPNTWNHDLKDGIGGSVERS